MTPVRFDAADVAIASLVLILDGALSVSMRLRIHRSLAIATLRMVLQLVALGYLLRAVFAIDTAWLTVALMLFMTLAAAREASARPRQRLRRRHYLIALVSVAAPALLTCGFAVVSLTPAMAGWSPRFIIPVAGILLGSVLNAVSIGLAGVLEGAPQEAAVIEGRLMLGYTFVEATRPLQERSVRHAMVPLVNQMSAAGIITMPGIMTGQVLAGMDPLQAATYQIVLMLLLAGGSGLGAIVAARVALRCLTDDRQRLRVDRLEDRR